VDDVSNTSIGFFPLRLRWVTTIYSKGERYRWSLTLTAINISNKFALYNFLDVQRDALM